MAVSASEWIRQLAERLGVAPPDEEERELLLALAAAAAHSSERTAAPISCWLAALAGRSPGEALDVARVLAEEIGERGGGPEAPSAPEAAPIEGPR